MHTSPIVIVDPVTVPEGELDRLSLIVEDAKSSGWLDLSLFPADVRAQLLFALDALAQGKQVAFVLVGTPLGVKEPPARDGLEASPSDCSEDRCRRARAMIPLSGNAPRAEDVIRRLRGD